eukprot:EG_transcript_28552
MYDLCLSAICHPHQLQLLQSFIRFGDQEFPGLSSLVQDTGVPENLDSYLGLREASPEAGNLEPPRSLLQKTNFDYWLLPAPNHSVSHRRTLYHATHSIPCFATFHPRSNTSSPSIFSA